MARPKGKPEQGYKFNSVVREKILDAIRSGATQQLAAQYAGINRDTLARWLQRGEEDESGEYHDFYVAASEARGEQAKITLDKIRSIADSTNAWQAHAWWLQSVYPRDYGKGAFGGPADETPEIRHVIEIVRGEAAPQIIEGRNVPTTYQIEESSGSGEVVRDSAANGSDYVD